MNGSIHDWLSLLVLKVAKARRRKYVVGQESAFYEEFFTERDFEACTVDVRRVLRNSEIQSVLSDCRADEIVVDLGCGVGDLFRILRADLRLIGLDTSLPTLQYALKVGRTKALVINGSLYELPISDGMADVVICLEVLEHLRDDARALDEIVRILRPGGRLILSLPGQFYFPEYLDFMGHWRHYTQATVMQMLDRVRLRKERLLRSYTRFNKFYFYVYLVFWVVAAVARRLTGRHVTLYSMRLPFDRRSLYERLAPILLKIAKSRAASDRDHGGAGIFLVAIKGQGGRE